MTVLRECWRRLWGALRRNPTDHDLERELRFHLEQAEEEEEELRGQGHSRAEAARMARARLGGVPQAMEALRDQRGLPWLDDLRIDLRIGMRGLARHPGFTATAALTLSIGSGATAAVATMSNALLFQPLPVPDPDELVVVAQLDELTAEFPHELSYPEYLDYRERNDVFEGLAAHAQADELLSIDGGADLDRIRERQLLRRPAGGCRARPHVSRRRRAPARRCAFRRADTSRVADAVRRGRGRPREGRAPRVGQHDRHRDHAGGIRGNRRPGARRAVRPRHRGRSSNRFGRGC